MRDRSSPSDNMTAVVSPVNDAAVLADLANLRLDQGHIQEAKQEYSALAELRSADLQAEAAAISNAPAEEQEDDWETLLDDAPITSKLEALAAAGRASKQQHKAPAAGAGATSPSSTPQPSSSKPRGRGSVTYHRDGDTHNSTATGSGRGRGSCGLLAMDEVDAGKGDSTDMLHVVEVYDLTWSVKDTELHAYLKPYRWNGISPALEWVDETRALVVFPSMDAATIFLDHGQHKYKVRRFRSGSVPDPSRFNLSPARHRPATTDVMARRLLSHHLGRKDIIDRESEQKLRGLRQQNREARRKRQTAVDAAWEEDE